MERKRYVSKGIMVLLTVVFLMGMALQDSWGEAKEIKLNLATWGPPKGTIADAIKWYVSEVDKRTDNRVKIKVFWAQSLAKQMELPHAVRTGTADMAALLSVYHAELFPLLTANLEALILWGGKVGQGLDAYRKLREEFPEVRDEFRKQNQELLAFWELDSLDITSTKPIRSLADMKGMKIRAVGAVLPKIYAAAGFTVVTMPSAEAYDALSRGLVEAVIGSYETAYKFKYYEICKHWTRVGVIGSTVAYGITINLGVWNKLPSDVKDVMKQVGEELTDRYPGLVTEENKKQEKVFRDAGMKFYDLSLADQEAWRAKIAKPLFEAYVEKVEKTGRYPNARKILQRYGELLGYKPWEYKE